MDDPAALDLDKPIGFFAEELNVNFTEAFQALGNALADQTLQSKWEEQFKTIPNLMKSYQQERPLGQRAYLLVYSALTNACAAICRRHHNLFTHEIIIDNEIILEQYLNVQLNNIRLLIDETFFSNSRALPILGKFVPVFQHWLEKYGQLTSVQAHNLSQSLPHQFFGELIRTWNQRPEYFQPVHEFLSKNPFLEAWREEQAWAEYYAKIQSLYTEPVFGDKHGMTLADVYIEPQFAVHERCFAEKDERLHTNRIQHEEKDTPFIDCKYDGSLHAYAQEFFDNEDSLNLGKKPSQILLLLGYPGQGKTSFTKRLVYDLLHDHDPSQKVLLIRLRSLQHPRELLQNPFAYLLQHLQSHSESQHLNLSEVQLKEARIILDGLDELYMKEGLTNDDIDEFCKILIRTGENHPQLKIILTSRYGYLNTEKFARQKILMLRLQPLSLDQQKSWLGKYKQDRFYPECRLNLDKLEEISDPKKTNFAHIRELINQPILLQMVASANFDIEASDTRSSLYDKLFTTLIDRNWDQQRQLENLQGITKKQLRKYLQEIALAIYQSDFEYLRRKDLEALPAAQRFQEKLESDSLVDPVKNLMVSFYLQEVVADSQDRSEDVSNYAIEFYHKSLQEYLVAEKIWHDVKGKFLDTNYDDEFHIDTGQKALETIFPLFASKVLSQEVVTYLVEIIEQNEETEKKKILREQLIKFLPYLLKKDFLLSYDSRQGNTPMDQATATWYGYWTVLSHLGLKENIIPVKEKERFAYFMILFLPGRFKYLHLDNQSLNEVWVNGIILNRSNLKKINLARASLRGADLIGTKLSDVNLRSATLTGVNFFRAELSNVDMSEAHINEAYFQTAELRRVDFRGSYMQGVVFKNANLFNIDFRGADIGGANFEGAVLNEAFLSQTRNLTLHQLQSTKSLKNCKGIPEEWHEELQDKM